MSMDMDDEADNLNYEKPDIDSDEDEEGGDFVLDLDLYPKKHQTTTKKLQRESVSAEVYGMFNKMNVYKPKVVPKSSETKSQIRERLGSVFMFSVLGDKEKEIVIDAMEECKFSSGDTVIKQGDDGAELYMVFSGSLKCLKRLKKGDEEDTFLRTYSANEVFGELALQYNAPRAATVVAEENTTCYSQDRDCFVSVVKDSATKRREKFETFVSKIELLQDLASYDRCKITDCLQTQKFKLGDFVIKQGDKGDRFYFIEEGTAKATKNDGSGEKIVYEYKENEYFGELSLLRDEPRAANVIATSDLVLAWIDRGAFKRLFGDLEKLLQKNTEKYSKYLQKA